MKTQSLEPSRDLLNHVRAAFVARGETLTEWCRARGLKIQNARAYLLGQRNGPVARRWRRKLVEAAMGEKQ